MFKNSRAFSLVELLVTIAIISILAAILLPLLATAKMHAQQSHCMTNLRQLEMLGAMYSNDNGKHFGYFNPNFQGGNSWMTSLEIDTNQNSIGVCPAARLGLEIPKTGYLQGTADQAWLIHMKNKSTVFGSYGFNSWFYSQLRYPALYALYTSFSFNGDGDVQKPSETPVFYDSTWMDGAPMEKNPPYHDLYTGSPLTTWADDMGRLTICRHGGVMPREVPRNLQRGETMPGAINIGMVDGHAQLVPLEGLWKLSWHRNWRVPYKRPDPPK